MDAVLFLRPARHFQSMELERSEAVFGSNASAPPRLRLTEGDCTGEIDRHKEEHRVHFENSTSRN